MTITDWKRCPPEARFWHATFTCPTCRRGVSIAKDVHTIALDGTVSPSFVCKQNGCTFHEFIILAGWTP
jgi:hypothetical protein